MERHANSEPSKCPGGELIVKRNYETVAQYEKREAKGLCSANCAKKHPKPAGNERRPLSTLSPLSNNYERSEREPIPKNLPYRSAAYTEFIRSKPCLVTGTSGPSDPHHSDIGHGKMGGKTGDDRQVPLSRWQHAELHHIGEKAFWEKHGIDVDAVILAMNEEWMGLGHKFLL